jgi:vancomycin permeability regulator SanA
MKKFYTLLICLLMFLYPIWLIMYGHKDRIQEVDVAVVFGNKVNPDGSLSKRLKARLDKCVELYNKGYFKKIIVSGGIGSEGFDEARSMKDYLLQNGIIDQVIIEDNTGKNTLKTALFVKLYMDKNSYKSAMVITQYFHIFRAKLAIKKVGIKEIYNAHAHYYELMDMYSIPRECIGIIKYLFTYHNLQ